MALDPSADVLRFIETHIDSVELLHVLMFLVDRKGESWPTAAISRELRSSESSVNMRVRTLVERKLLAADALKDGKVEYRAGANAPESVVIEALAYYKLAPYRVVEMIFSKRTNAIQSIADAFRFRKED
ncbi:MAG: hypothetical protein JST04_09190 [Bdellovibrionales bacterium]|nr:hypothetical protein [Bdellovibrionales bacterium]